MCYNFYRQIGMMKDSDKFEANFQNFIQKYKCSIHGKQQSFVCIDDSCSKKGLICSVCLTINGPHKNHDAIDIAQFYDKYCQNLPNSTPPSALQKIHIQTQEIYQNLLKFLTDFHQFCSNTIQKYINQKSIEHQKIPTHSCRQDLKSDLITCNFSSIQQFNKIITNILKNQPNSQTPTAPPSQHKQIFHAEFYQSNLQGQANLITKFLTQIQNQLKNIFNNFNHNKNLCCSYKNPTCLEHPNSIYIGQHSNQMPEGKGILFDKINNLIVMGSFINGQVTNFGEIYNQKQDHYVGEFDQNMKHGYGRYLWNLEKNSYVGQFYLGKRHGKGTFRWADGSQYIGEFRDGQQQGYGILFREGKQVEYEGYWINGQYHGQGIQIFDNGQKFQGNFKNDKFHGKGILTKQDQIIHGTWQENELISVTQIKTLKNKKELNAIKP